MSAELINLRTARKRGKRREEDERARLNRAAYGRTSHERTLEDARRVKATQNLTNHRLETGDGR